MKISEIHLKQVCKIGQGNKCCRYLVVGSQGFECVKHTAIKDLLDSRVEDKLMVAQGDNCAGWGRGRNDRYEEVVENYENQTFGN